MSRWRLQKHGDLYEQGGFWKLRWQEDQLKPDGSVKRGWSKPVWIGPAQGQGRLTKKEAQRIAWDNFLSKIDQNNKVPMSVATLGDFVERRFQPEHIDMKKFSGQQFYRHMLAHVIPSLGDIRLRDVRQDDVQRLVSSVLRSGLSVQTAKHVKNVVSAIFRHAEAVGWFTGTNPAKHVKLPEMVRKVTHATSWEQNEEIIKALKSPYSEMVFTSVMTSMNVAEICGLIWKWLNLTDGWVIVDGEAIKPWHAGIRQQWYRGHYGSLKAGSRRRDVFIPPSLAQALLCLKQRPLWTGPEDPVFASREGTPVDAHNVAKRYLKPLGKRLGMPWLSWHCLRRSFATATDRFGLTHGERRAMMGHSSDSMTNLYTRTPSDQAMDILEEMANRLVRKPEGKIQ